MFHHGYSCVLKVAAYRYQMFYLTHPAPLPSCLIMSRSYIWEITNVDAINVNTSLPGVVFCWSYGSVVTIVDLPPPPLHKATPPAFAHVLFDLVCRYINVNLKYFNYANVCIVLVYWTNRNGFLSDETVGMLEKNHLLPRNYENKLSDTIHVIKGGR